MAQTTILVVDDKANVRRLLQDYLTEQGYRTLVAENGREALYVARGEKPWFSGPTPCPVVTSAPSLIASST